MSKVDNIDEVVNAITSKVAERLAGMGIGTAVRNQVPPLQVTVADESTYDVKLARIIDHTLLKPDASKEQLIKVCEEALKYKFCTVCVNSANIPLVADLLAGSSVSPIAVIGFPLGAASTEAKVFEAKEAIKNGAREIDMVVNIGALKSKDYKRVYNDIKEVVAASAPYKVKVILENSNLTDDEKIVACTLSKTAGAAFVKTSTGFGSGGATPEDLRLMRRIVGTDMQVKASGGIRTRADADAAIAAGADRIGASASVEIVKGSAKKEEDKTITKYGKKFVQEKKGSTTNKTKKSGGLY